MDPARAVVVPQHVNLNAANQQLLVRATGQFTLISENVQTLNRLVVILVVPLQHAVLQHQNAVHL